MRPVEDIQTPARAVNTNTDGCPLDFSDMAPERWTDTRCNALAARSERQALIATSAVSGLGALPCSAMGGDFGSVDGRRGVASEAKVRGEEKRGGEPCRTRWQGDDSQQVWRGNPPTRGHVDDSGVSDGAREVTSEKCVVALCAAQAKDAMSDTQTRAPRTDSTDAMAGAAGAVVSGHEGGGAATAAPDTTVRSFSRATPRRSPRLTRPPSLVELRCALGLTTATGCCVCCGRRAPRELSFHCACMRHISVVAQRVAGAAKRVYGQTCEVYMLDTERHIAYTTRLGAPREGDLYVWCVDESQTVAGVALADGQQVTALPLHEGACVTRRTRRAMTEMETLTRLMRVFMTVEGAAPRHPPIASPTTHEIADKPHTHVDGVRKPQDILTPCRRTIDVVGVTQTPSTTMADSTSRVETTKKSVPGMLLMDGRPAPMPVASPPAPAPQVVVEKESAAVHASPHVSAVPHPGPPGKVGVDSGVRTESVERDTKMRDMDGSGVAMPSCMPVSEASGGSREREQLRQNMTCSLTRGDARESGMTRVGDVVDGEGGRTEPACCRVQSPRPPADESPAGLDDTLTAAVISRAGTRTTSTTSSPSEESRQHETSVVNLIDSSGMTSEERARELRSDMTRAKESTPEVPGHGPRPPDTELVGASLRRTEKARMKAWDMRARFPPAQPTTESDRGVRTCTTTGTRSGPSVNGQQLITNQRDGSETGPPQERNLRDGHVADRRDAHRCGPQSRLCVAQTCAPVCRGVPGHICSQCGRDSVRYATLEYAHRDCVFSRTEQDTPLTDRDTLHKPYEYDTRARDARSYCESLVTCARAMDERCACECRAPDGACIFRDVQRPVFAAIDSQPLETERKVDKRHADGAQAVSSSVGVNDQIAGGRQPTGLPRQDGHGRRDALPLPQTMSTCDVVPRGATRTAEQCAEQQREVMASPAGIASATTATRERDERISWSGPVGVSEFSRQLPVKVDIRMPTMEDSTTSHERMTRNSNIRLACAATDGTRAPPCVSDVRGEGGGCVGLCARGDGHAREESGEEERGHALACDGHVRKDSGTDERSQALTYGGHAREEGGTDERSHALVCDGHAREESGTDERSHALACDGRVREESGKEERRHALRMCDGHARGKKTLHAPSVTVQAPRENHVSDRDDENNKMPERADVRSDVWMASAATTCSRSSGHVRSHSQPTRESPRRAPRTRSLCSTNLSVMPDASSESCHDVLPLTPVMKLHSDTLVCHRVHESTRRDVRYTEQTCSKPHACLSRRTDGHKDDLPLMPMIGDSPSIRPLPDQTVCGHRQPFVALTRATAISVPKMTRTREYTCTDTCAENKNLLDEDVCVPETSDDELSHQCIVELPGGERARYYSSTSDMQASECAYRFSFASGVPAGEPMRLYSSTRDMQPVPTSIPVPAAASLGPAPRTVHIEPLALFPGFMTDPRRHSFSDTRELARLDTGAPSGSRVGRDEQKIIDEQRRRIDELADMLAKQRVQMDMQLTQMQSFTDHVRAFEKALPGTDNRAPLQPHTAPAAIASGAAAAAAAAQRRDGLSTDMTRDALDTGVSSTQWGARAQSSARPPVLPTHPENLAGITGIDLTDMADEDDTRLQDQQLSAMEKMMMMMADSTMRAALPSPPQYDGTTSVREFVQRVCTFKRANRVPTRVLRSLLLTRGVIFVDKTRACDWLIDQQETLSAMTLIQILSKMVDDFGGKDEMAIYERLFWICIRRWAG
jgi:uncharacterized coiled-coil protein SlyX